MKYNINSYSNEVEDLFRNNVRHLFLYITNKCDLRCKQCFYASNLGSGDMSLDTAFLHLEKFKSLGATHLTLLGGEPTLYDISNKWNKLNALINFALNIGYSNLRIDTNGQFPATFFDEICKSQKIEISFSLDGLDDKSNDSLRGQGTFFNCCDNIKISSNYFRTSVTICVSRLNYFSVENQIERLLEFGLESVNFHPLLFVGNEQDKYIKDTSITIEEWKMLYAQLARTYSGSCSRSLRIPPRIKLSTHGAEAGYCSLRARDRAHVQPNGEIRICPLNVGGKYKVGVAKDGQIELERHYQETSIIADNSYCAVQNGSPYNEQPLCVSFKPLLS